MLLVFAGTVNAQMNKITGIGQNPVDVINFFYDTQFQNESMCFNSGALANATEQVSIASAVNYVKDGVFGQISTGYITLSGDTQAVSTTKLYVFSYDVANTTTEITIGAAGETDIKNIEIPEGNILFGALKIVTDGSTQFVPGTTSTAAAGITETYYNYAVKPCKVRVSKTN